MDDTPIDNNAAEHNNSNSDISHFQAVKYSSATGNLPLTARYAEVFMFVGKDNEVGTGVSSTEAMVWQLNVVLQGEQRITGHITQINSLESKRARVEADMSDINSKLEDVPEDFESSPALLEAVLKDQQELEGLAQLSEVLALEIQRLETAIEKVHEDTRYTKAQLFSDWKETLAEGGLLEPFVEEVETQIPALQRTNPLGMEAQARPTPTPSELENFAIVDVREAALNEITQNAIQVQDAQERFEDLPNHYNKEYDGYTACVETGTITASKSEFDAVMLLDSQGAATKLIQAKEEFEQARNHARELGLTLDSYDQESCFIDYPDDGYRESLENQWIAHVDRGRIVRWMESEDEMPTEAECDEWDSKTVDISDSVSAIADTCKSRKRIDHWRSMCESLDAEKIIEAGVEC